MRPYRLRMEGFGSFREPADVDFADVDYFALVGPTGAGKSTVIDAICFALYGTVPRWAKENVVSLALAPSASAGSVALVFEAGGRRFGVVRVLSRNAKGVVGTREARIEELDPGASAADHGIVDLLAAAVSPLAEGADAVTAEVERLTGLEYKYFTQCVVLPQGRFAEFLHAKPAQRQDLLVQLLDAAVYEGIRRRAVQEEETAARNAAFARDQLAELAGADEEAERAAAVRLKTLREITGWIDAEIEALRERDAAVLAKEAERRETAALLATLTSLALPAEVPTLAGGLRAATDEVTALAAEVAALEAREQRAEDALAALGDRAAPAHALAVLDDLDRATGEHGTAAARAAAAADATGPLADQVGRAKDELAAAETARDRERTAHAAVALAARLAVGDPCPACLRPVTELPHHPAPADLQTAERAVRERAKDRDQAVARHHDAQVTAARLQQVADGLAGTIAELTGQVGGLASGDRESIETALAAIEAAEKDATLARQDTRGARERLRGAERHAERLRRTAERSWQEVAAARDTVVALGAPPLDRDDLHRAWTSLLTWRDEAAEGRRQAMTALEEDLARAVERRDEERAALVARLRGHELPVPEGAAPGRITQTVAAETARAEAALDRVREARERASRLTGRARELEQEARVAHDLALLLRADQFERWLCAEALELLVTAASETLRELSDGQYEFALGARSEIEVIDYAEAGMRRNVRTLSGGETFQAALALALALSDQVAGLAAASSRSLDSIFLDEGFGTLDPATLDTVATTLERLAAGRERMVGLVTHVPALAERVPVRFEISRDGSGSHLERRAT
ncbi:AAA family ATPase [Streptosporangium sp. KLBMP 9127]|nr:SMC family ATPase [Streptosporangium sp. KLBMP 9127]